MSWGAKPLRALKTSSDVQINSQTQGAHMQSVPADASSTTGLFLQINLLAPDDFFESTSFFFLRPTAENILSYPQLVSEGLH